VSFSGPSTTLPLPAGAQDRASWLLQLPMLAAAVQAHWTAGPQQREPAGLHHPRRGPALALHRGGRGDPARPQGTPLRTWRLAREPVGPYDSRVEVWLARDHGLVPLRLRFTTPPSDVPLELRLSEGLPPAEPDMPRP
jgi:hypothetical protein